MDYRLGTKKLAKCLICLGFRPEKEAKSSHHKYKAPIGHNIPEGVRPFIIVILGKKSYSDETAAKYIKDITALGFSADNIGKCIDK